MAERALELQNEIERTADRRARRVLRYIEPRSTGSLRSCALFPWGLTSIPCPTGVWRHAAARAKAIFQSQSRLPEFVLNPLEPFDVQTRISRVYDDWVSEGLIDSHSYAAR